MNMSFAYILNNWCGQQLTVSVESISPTHDSCAFSSPLTKFMNLGKHEFRMNWQNFIEFSIISHIPHNHLDSTFLRHLNVFAFHWGSHIGYVMHVWLWLLMFKQCFSFVQCFLFRLLLSLLNGCVSKRKTRRKLHIDIKCERKSNIKMSARIKSHI